MRDSKEDLASSKSSTLQANCSTCSQLDETLPQQVGADFYLVQVAIIERERKEFEQKEFSVLSVFSKKFQLETSSKEPK